MSFLGGVPESLHGEAQVVQYTPQEHCQIHSVPDEYKTKANE